MRLGRVRCPVCGKDHVVSVYQTKGVAMLRIGWHFVLCGDGTKIWIPKNAPEELVKLVKKVVGFDFMRSFRLWRLWERGWNVEDAYEALKEIGIKLIIAFNELTTIRNYAPASVVG